MKVLSIGNSFSHDAHRYLHELALGYGEDIYTANLFIGGCSLETHYDNLTNDLPAYAFEVNGGEGERAISLREALSLEKWDYITLQQASHLSAKYESYLPFIKVIADYVREASPSSKLVIHETWAYEEGSERLFDVAGYKTMRAMFDDISRSYKKAAQEIGADGIIPCGTAMMNAFSNYSLKVYRDTYHASFGVGRYLLALTWLKWLTHKDISADDFSRFDEPVSDAERKNIISVVQNLFKETENENN